MSYQELIRRLEEIVARFPLRRYGFPNDGPDLVTEANLRLIRYWHTDIEEGRYPPASYLWSTVRSVITDHWRRERKRRNTGSLEELECYGNDRETSGSRVADHPLLADSARPGPERSTYGSEVGRAIQDCLQSLLEDRRRALVLKLEGMTISEVAEFLGLEYKQADNLIARGRKNLRECLAKKGFSHEE